MASTKRGCATREVYFAVGNFMSWFPAPDESPTADNVHAGGDSTTLLNGFASINGSVYGHRKYELNWSYLNRDQAELFRRLFMNRGNEWVSYADPFSFNNMLSPLMGLPYLHVHAGTPFAYNDWGKQTLFESPKFDQVTGHPTVTLKADLAASSNAAPPLNSKLNGRQQSLALSKPGTYTERVVIPEGHYATFFAYGFEDGKRPFEWAFGRVDDNGLPFHVVTKVKNQVFSFGEGVWEITMRPLQDGQLSWCGLRITPYDPAQVIAGPAEYEFTYPAGGGNLKVVPGTARVVTVNNYRGHFSASVSLEECYSW